MTKLRFVTRHSDKSKISYRFLSLTSDISSGDVLKGCWQCSCQHPQRDVRQLNKVFVNPLTPLTKPLANIAKHCRANKPKVCFRFCLGVRCPIKFVILTSSSNWHVWLTNQRFVRTSLLTSSLKMSDISWRFVSIIIIKKLCFDIFLVC